MKTVRLDIAIIPDDKLLLETERLSKSLSKNFQTYFTLDNQSFYSHLTLYSPEFPTNRKQSIIKVVKKISHEVNKFTANLEKGFQFQDGFIGIQVENSINLRNLHNKVVDRLNSSREGELREKYKGQSVLEKYTTEQLSNIKSYGYPDVKSLFDPHITLTRLVNTEETKAAIEIIDLESSILHVEKLGIFEMGKDGTCIKKIAEYALN